jgi:agmatinase
MRLNDRQFLGLDPEFTKLDTSAVTVLPFPYEGGISYGAGTAHAPDAVIKSSYFLELYDEVLDGEPYRMGISTLAPPSVPDQSERMIVSIYQSVYELLEMNKFTVVIGGDHSITSGTIRAMKEKFGMISVIQLDAHADLRDSYEESPLSHASVMARTLEITPHILQLGIRSLSVEEADRVHRENLKMVTMDQIRNGKWNLKKLLDALPDPVFLTLDVDALDWSVIRSTGTPEPGGFTWDESLAILREIFTRKQVVGLDVVELAYNPQDQCSPFAAAKLIYKMLGFALQSRMDHQHQPLPRTPAGSLLIP